VREQYKGESKAKQEEEDAEKRAKNLEQAKKVTIQENSSFPKATLVKTSACGQHRGARIKVYGWVHRLRRQGNTF